jgi:DNA-binding HxlR family transcriptional regulator
METYHYQALKTGSLGYTELRSIVSEPTKKVLTDHLRELEADRIISRTATAGRNGRTEYSLTDYGRTLIPVLAVMRAWGQRHRELVLGQPRNAEDGTDPCATPHISPQRRALGVRKEREHKLSRQPVSGNKKVPS